MNRPLVREIAMKVLYSECVGGADTIEAALEQSELPEQFSNPDRVFLDNIIFGVKEHREQLDLLIAENAIGWTLDRIAKVDLSILRIALYEMLYEPTIPVGATINEAVELAKRYGDVKSYGFVNGILAAVSKSIDK